MVLARTALASCCSSGGGGGVFAGQRADGHPFAAMTLDELAGGGGASGGHDGLSSSGTTTSPGAACADVEVNESYLPLLYLRRAELADSGGPGRNRGGLGCLNVITPHAADGPVGVVSFAQGLQHPAAAGLGGGEPGRQSIYAIDDCAAALQLADGQAEAVDLELPTRRSAISAGQAHVAVSQGGGGYGDPLERDPLAVAEDVRLGRVTPRRATLDYGTVVVADGQASWVLDAAATTRLRGQQRQRRLGGRVPVARNGATGTRFSEALAIRPDGSMECRHCGTLLAPAGGDAYARMIDDAAPTRSVAPWSAGYPGGERFRLHRLYCPGCATQVDAQVLLRGEPVLRAAEPLTHRPA